MEIRYRTECFDDSWTDDEGNSWGGTYCVEVPYEWHILTVTLTARNFVDIITPRLVTQDEQERYALLMLTKGNRQYVGTPFDFNWLPFVTSYYGYRIHPIDQVKRMHTGVDIALPEGTPILAGGVGVVVESGYNGGYGYAILIYYGNGISARYAHCSVLHFTVGQTVQAGDIIALVGNTGASTGPHLHIEVIKNGRFLNPLFFVMGTID
jgi:murein DD-endopeptidase MepM/ murein hydrolase activator NlpD